MTAANLAPSLTPAYKPPRDEGLAILFIDASLIVVDKPAGLLSVPGRGENKHDCMAARVQQRHPEALIVHRLDMDTSGLILFARSAEIQRALSIAFAERQVGKTYTALASGKPQPASGEINLPLITDWPQRPLQKVDHAIGKPSLTRYTVLDFDSNTHCSRVALEPLTGRSHQLRVHMASIGHPLLGDPLYAPPEVRALMPRLALHATELRLQHPVTQDALEFSSPAPF